MQNFNEKFLLDVTSVILIVVSRLTMEDQKTIQRIRSQLSKTQKLFVIHNFSDTSDPNQITGLIQTEIINIFNVDEALYSGDLKTGANRLYYVEKEQENVCHLVLAKQFTPAGAFYNDSSKEIIFTTCSVAKPLNFSLQDALINFLHNKFAEFVNKNHDPGSYSFLVENLAEGEQGETKKVIKMLQPLGKGQCSLKSSNYDEFGHMKSWVESRQSNDITHEFCEEADSFVWKIKMPELKENDVKSVKVYPIKEESGFCLVAEGARSQLQCEKSNNVRGEFIVMTKMIEPVTKFEEFEKESTKTFTSDSLLITWKRLDISSDEVN